MIQIVDAPDRAAAAKVLLTTTSRGSVSTETFPAFTESEYRKIISELK